MRFAVARFVALASLSAGLFDGVPARAASLQKLNQSEWGVSGLPSYVNMYVYVPDKLAAKPPIVVALHHCQGTGPGTYNEMSSLVSIANNNGFIMIFPEATGENCWDAGSARSLKHDGGGDTQAIVQMVRYTLSKHNGDANRVYSVGGSSGGIMTEALLGVYPDVFMAGVSLMGVPCGCWAQNYNDATGSGTSDQWSGPCAGGTVSKTGPQWGDLVRSYFPGYAGHRPRLQHWHGTADTTLNFKNLAEDVKEWTNLLSLSETPTGNDTPKSGTTHQFWKNSCGYTVYETFSLSGVGHSVPFDGNAVAAYFGLDKSGGQDPETAACPGAMPGGAGSGGAGGASGSGGTSSSGGASSGGGPSGAGGLGAANGGTTGSGNGGSRPFGGGTPSGSGGQVVGAAGATGAVGSGGVQPPGMGGSTGNVVTGPPGTQASGGASAIPGITAVAGATAGSAGSGSMEAEVEPPGCTCALRDDAARPAAMGTAVLLGGAGLLRRSRRRRRTSTRVD